MTIDTVQLLADLPRPWYIAPDGDRFFGIYSHTGELLLCVESEPAAAFVVALVNAVTVDHAPTKLEQRATITADIAARVSWSAPATAAADSARVCSHCQREIEITPTYTQSYVLFDDGSYLCGECDTPEYWASRKLDPQTGRALTPPTPADTE